MYGYKDIFHCRLFTLTRRLHRTKIKNETVNPNLKNFDRYSMPLVQGYDSSSDEDDEEKKNVAPTMP